MRNLNRAALAAIAGAAGCLCIPAPACAQNLQISPISIQLQPGQMTTTLMVTNVGAAAAALQVRPFQWDQASGVDDLKPTTELAVSPPITEVAAGQTQTFRLVLRHPATGHEAAYRLLLDQLPAAGDAGTVRVMLRFSIPVFATPPGHMEKGLDWRIALDGGGASLVARNQGGEHVRILNVQLSPSNGPRIAVPTNANPYVLPGAERSWRLAASSPPRPGSMLHLAATSDGGPVDAMVRVAGP